MPATARKPGALDRPHVLTARVQARIVRALWRGSFLTTACHQAGIDPSTFYYWRRLYRAGVEHAQVYADFFHTIKRAEALAEIEALGVVRSGRKGWQGSAWFLERRFRSRWARRTVVVIKGLPKDPKDLSRLSDEELDAIEEQLRRYE